MNIKLTFFVIIFVMFFGSIKAQTQRSLVESISVRFSEDVIMSPGALSLEGAISGPVDLTQASFEYYAKDHTAVWTLAHTLFDDSYTGTLDRTMISDSSGNYLATDETGGFFSFHVLFGDANGDARVDLVDLCYLASRWFKDPADTGLDIDGNGIINNVDFSAFSRNFCKGL